MENNEYVLNKSAQVSNLEISDSDMNKINKYTLEKLTKDEVFVFKVAMCDNEIDRDYEVFTLKALNDMAKLFVGKTVIKDHTARADNQVARIYATEVVADTTKTTQRGEVYTQLVAHCYMLKTESNKDIIAEIKGGIKKEVSVGFRSEKAVCSICGTDNRKKWCDHYNGKKYEGKLCYFTMEDVTDTYELSFVAVPAQPKAGTVKNYGGERQTSDKQATMSGEIATNEPEEISGNDEMPEENNENVPVNENKALEESINLRVRLVDSFLNANKN